MAKKIKEPKPNYMLIAGIVLLAVIAVVVIGRLKNASTAPSPPDIQIDTGMENGQPWIGGKNATVTIIEYSDFQCPYCSRGAGSIKQVEDHYGAKVKVIFRNYPLGRHVNAYTAALAGECAAEQGRFWEYHDKMFANQQQLDAGSLKQYASALGLNTAQFNACLDSQAYKAEVDKDIADGNAAGVDGTPMFFVNKQVISGAMPFDTFKKAIDSMLPK